jgi:NAD(P)-dependent dehydrogenase (short-subunit alcohol dehydrogenase family)
MRDFDDMVVFVTGSATGLGAALALGAAQRGAKAVVLNCTKSLKEAEETADQVRTAGAAVTIAQGDVGDDAACRDIAAKAGAFGRIDAMANNAGITKHAPNHAQLDALTDEDFLRLYRINVVGPFQMVRACQSLMQAAVKPASVLMVSSIAGVTGIGSSVAYAATKGALNALCPGFIDTRWFTDAYGEETTARIRANVESTTPLKVASKPEDIADAGLFLMSPMSRHITGETLMVDAGLHLGFAPLAAR